MPKERNTIQTPIFGHRPPQVHTVSQGIVHCAVQATLVSMVVTSVLSVEQALTIANMVHIVSILKNKTVQITFSSFLTISHIHPVF